MFKVTQRHLRYLLWLLLSIPAIPLLVDFIYDERYYSELMYESGLLSIQLLFLTLCVTPFRLLTQKYQVLKSTNRWLMVSRRYFGVASFGYACIHLLVYIREYPALADIFSQMFELDIALGWVAMLIMTALAVTSNNYSVRRLGPKWKRLHLWVYPVPVLLYFHWYLFGFFIEVLNFWYIPFIAIQTYRCFIQYLRNKKSARVQPVS